jgi:protein TonB
MAENALSKLFNRWDLPEAQSRLDLVFADRFKGYGAYVVRSRFRMAMTIATIVACLFSLVTAYVPYALEKYKVKEVKPAKKVKVTTLEDVKAPEEEKEKPKDPPKIQEPEPVAAQAYVVPKVNENAAKDDPVNPPDFITNTGSKNVAGVSDPTLPDFNENMGGGPVGGSGNGQPVGQVQVKASFPGGEAAFREFVATEFQYPVRCQDEGINGAVILRFVVDKIGKISNIQVIEETQSCVEFTTEAKRVLSKSPRWIPGQNNGKFVVSWREIPIKLNVE